MGNLLRLLTFDLWPLQELDHYHLNDSCHTCQGSPAFQPPEIASGVQDSWSGFKADIWAAGVTLWVCRGWVLPLIGLIGGSTDWKLDRTWMLFSLARFHFTTGKFPFEGDNVYKLFGAISTGVFQIPDDLSPLLQELLRGMLRKNSSERFSIQEIRLHS